MLFFLAEFAENTQTNEAAHKVSRRFFLSSENRKLSKAVYHCLRGHFFQADLGGFNLTVHLCNGDFANSLSLAYDASTHKHVQRWHAVLKQRSVLFLSYPSS